MEDIRDPMLISECVKRLPGIGNVLSAYNPFIRRYGRGELITSPDRPLDHILIVASGMAFIYAIASDGSDMQIAVAEKGTIIGDAEFAEHGSTALFVEARDDVDCLAIPLDGQRQKLERDPCFLMALSASLAGKLRSASMNRIDDRPLEERLLSYVRYGCEGSVMEGIERATYSLHCSRRQLHRLLAKLCGEGRLERIGKGRYRIC